MNLIPYFDKTSFGAYSGEIISIVLGRGYLNPDLDRVNPDDTRERQECHIVVFMVGTKC